MLVVATWPILKSLEARLGNRRAPAVALMTLGLLLLLVIPLWAAIDTIAEHADDVSGLAKRVAESGLPQPPEWVGKLPLVGKRLSATLAAWADAGPAGLEARLGPYASDAAAVGVRPGGQSRRHAGPVPAGRDSLRRHVLRAANRRRSGVRRFGRRLAGQRGEDSVILAGKAIRSVALGVGVTAVVQTVLGGIGLAVAGVPFASLLSAVMLMLCIAQLGPALVLFPAVAWMYWTGENAWATFLLVWSVVVSTPGQLPAADADQEGGGPAAPADLRRRDRRAAGLWPDRDLRRTGGAGGHLTSLLVAWVGRRSSRGRWSR